MSKSNSSENNYLKLVFNNTTWAGFGDVTGLVGSTSAGSLYVALHTADPGESGNQATSEATYTSYARVAVARTSGGWTVSGNTAANTATVTFPQCTGGTNTITHLSVGIAGSGSSEIIYSGALNDSLAVSNLITPLFNAGAIVVTED